MDRAIEFATLGEYGLEVPGADAPAPGTGRSALSVGRRPGAVASAGSPSHRGAPARRARCVRAATPAGRRAALPAPDPLTRVAAPIPAAAAPDPASRVEGRTAVAAAPDPATRTAAPAMVVSRVPAARVRQRGGSVPPAPQPCVARESG
jgi:hypothetical protein